MIVLLPLRSAFAVTRTCGADPRANTTNVLCASPSGPCTPYAVTLSSNIEVTSGGCAFDLGGRTLSVQKTFQMVGNDGYITVSNAAAITITGTGRLKARGDFGQPSGVTIPGGTIELASSGTITVMNNGQIDVSGDPAGDIEFFATGAVDLQAGSTVQGNGISASVSGGYRFSDGATIDIESSTGSVTVGGAVNLHGSNHGQGGELDLVAAKNIKVQQSVDASGGADDGGYVSLVAGDDVTITKNVDVSSHGGGGFGGLMDVAAGVDEIGGDHLGGTFTLDGATLDLSGSDGDSSGGDGGALFVTAAGALRIQGSSVIKLPGGQHFDGSGGAVVLDSTDGDLNKVGPLDGDLTVEGQIVADSGGANGEGGVVELDAGRNLIVSASVNVSGKDVAGAVEAYAGGAVQLNGVISAGATSSAGLGGSVVITAGLAQDATLTVAQDILASGTGGFRGESIILTGCGLTVTSGVKVDGHAGALPGNTAIALVARHPMQLQGNAQFLAYPGGTITTFHPSGQIPVISSGVTFNPPRTDSIVPDRPFPACPTTTPIPATTPTPASTGTAAPA